MTNDTPNHPPKRMTASMPHIAAVLSIAIGLSIMIGLSTTVGLSTAAAQDVPACALTGSMTVMIGGKPALRLADVANCPPSLYDIIGSVQIDGQPMVHFKSGIFGKLRCFSGPSPSVSAEGKQASAAGDVACATK